MTLAVLPAAAAAAVFLAIWPWTARYDRRPTPRLLATLVLTSAAIVVLILALGLARRLEPRMLAAAAAVLVSTVGGTGWTIGARGSASLRVRGPTPLGLALGLLTLLAYAVIAGVGALVPPYGWDTMVYHLTDVLHAAATRGLDPFPFPGGAFWFPQVGEVHGMWAFLLSGAGDESYRWTGLALLPFGLTAGVAVRAAAEAIGLDRTLPWIAPAVMLAPIVLIQPLSGYVDVAFAALLLASFAFAVLFADERRFSHLAFASVAAGLAFGVKLSFLFYCLPLVFVVVPAALESTRLDRRLLARGALLVALFIVAGGYWSVRNWIVTGNPLYPSRIAVAEAVIFDGPQEVEPSPRQESWFVSSPGEWLRYPFLETMYDVPAYSLENGFGPLFAAGLVALLPALFFAARRRERLVLSVLLAAPLTIAAWLALSPYREPRYVIALVGYAVLALAWLTEWLRTPRVLTGAIAAGIVFGAVGGMASAAPYLPEVVARARQGTWRATAFYPLYYGTAGDAFEWLHRLRPGPTIAYTNPSFLAPLLGGHGRHRVVYAPTSDDPPIGDVPRTNSYARWRRFLREERVDRLVVWVPWWGETRTLRTEEWIAQHPGDFALLQDFGGRARIFEPRFHEASPATPPGLPLARADAWRFEHATGAEASVSSDDHGLAIRYRFDTEENDYCEIRADLDEKDWSRHATLSFDLENVEPADAILFVYVKDRDPRRACRFEVDLRGVTATKRVRLALDAPDWTTRGFDRARVTSVHLVLDDAVDTQRGRGVVRLGDFRLAPPEDEDGG